MTSVQIETTKQAINDSTSNGNARHDSMGKASNYLYKCRKLNRLLARYMAHLNLLIVIDMVFSILLKLGYFSFHCYNKSFKSLIDM